MTTPNAATYELVTDRIARILLDESATTPDDTDDLSAELLAVFATLPADSRQAVLNMGRIFKAGGAWADELLALCGAGDMAAVNVWLESHRTTPN